MVLYRETSSEIGEMASDLVAEANAELAQVARPDGGASASFSRGIGALAVFRASFLPIA
jgi:hypothetical protein